jgi:hypothetical protein
MARRAPMLRVGPPPECLLAAVTALQHSANSRSLTTAIGAPQAAGDVSSVPVADAKPRPPRESHTETVEGTAREGAP